MSTLTVYLFSTFFMLGVAYAIFGIFFRRDYTLKGRLTPFSIFIGSLIFFLWGGFPYIYGPSDWPAVHVGSLLKVIGLLILFGGLALMFGAMIWLGLLRTFGQKTNGLMQTGFYRISRNPQVLGCMLFGIGFAVLWPSWYALGWVMLFAVIAHMMVLSEVEHLRNTYGEEYVNYCERVPRYIGFRRES